MKKPVRSNTSRPDDDPDFESFWGFYPRKVGKKGAYDKWRAQIRRGAQPLDLITAAKHYGQQCRLETREERYIKYPATFLGPSDYWRECLDPPSSQQADRYLKGMAKLAAMKAAAGEEAVE